MAPDTAFGRAMEELFDEGLRHARPVEVTARGSIGSARSPASIQSAYGCILVHLHAAGTHMRFEERNVPLGSAADSTIRRSADVDVKRQESVEARNMELMQTLDDAWNAQDLDTFEKRHRDDVVVKWPGQPPTHGVGAHRQEALDFFRTFPNQHLDNRPYKTFFASGDWTCSIAHFTGTMTGPMKVPDGTEIPATGKSFDVDFCTVARWDDNGQIIEENLFYDLVGFMKQIGLS